MERKTSHLRGHADSAAVRLFRVMHLDPEWKQYLPVLSQHVVVELLHIRWRAGMLHVPASCWCASGQWWIDAYNPSCML